MTEEEYIKKRYDNSTKCFSYRPSILLTAIIILLSSFFQICSSQNEQIKENWILKDPFEQKVFIENNEGQFDGKNGRASKIYFSTCIGGINLYFSSTGIIYRNNEFSKLAEEQVEKSEYNVKRKEGDTLRTKTSYFSVKWEGANSDVQIISEDKVPYYYTYPKDDKHTIIAHAYKRIIYKNLYPAIDVEYSFPDEEEKKGIKYAIVVHPNADLSKVKLLYEDAQSLKKNIHGDVEITSAFGLFTDHAPDKIFYREDKTEIKATSLLDGKTLNFDVNTYDHSKTLIIDPWTTNPIINYNSAYDLNYDLNGNVFVYGGWNPFQLVKLNSTGSIQWTFNALFPFPGGNPSLDYGGQYYGDFVVDQTTGTSYLGEGFDDNPGPSVLKVNSLGIQVATFALDYLMDEIWRMEFDQCAKQIILAGGGTLGTSQAAVIDTSMAWVTYESSTTNVNSCCYDVTLLTLDGGDCYMATADPSGSSNVNKLLKCPFPNLLPTIFSVPDGYHFQESFGAAYVNGGVQRANGMNGMTASSNWLYLYDGSILKRFSKTSGMLIGSDTISNTASHWGGLDVDDCDHIYLGNNSTIEVHDSSLNTINSISTAGAVFDLHLAPNNKLYVCGNAFVSSYSLVPLTTISFSKTDASVCSGIGGTATANFSSCNINSSAFSYQWSNGQLNQTATNLSPGTYTVTISRNCHFNYTDTVHIEATTSPSLLSIATTQTNVICNGQNNGAATIIINGGVLPYSYNWMPSVSVSNSASNLSPGTYTVTIMDSGNCAGQAILNITHYSQFCMT